MALSQYVLPGPAVPGFPFRTYFTHTVTPFWLELSPIFTTIESAPDAAVAGIVAFTCNTPATKSGASPSHCNCAGWPPIHTDTGSCGVGVYGGAAVATVTAPVACAGVVKPSPVI